MALPKLSKTLVSYIVGLMVTTPYFAAAVTSAPRDLRNSA